MAERNRMIEALSAHDAGAMRQLLLEHLDHKRDAVVEQLRAASKLVEGVAR